MALVSGPIGNVNSVIHNFGRDWLQEIGGPAQTVTLSLGALLVIVLTLNYFFQFRPIAYGAYLPLFIKLILVQSIVSSWANFAFIHHLLTEVPFQLSAGIIRVSGGSKVPDISTVYTILDGLSGGLVGVGAFFIAVTTMFSIGMFVPAQLVLSLGLAIAGSTVAIVAGAKIALAIAIVLAPIFIPTIMMQSSNFLFQGWIRFALGAAVTPVVYAAMMAIVLSAIGAGFSRSIGGVIGSLVLIITSVALVRQIPAIVQSIMGAASVVMGSLPGSSPANAMRRDQNQYRDRANAARQIQKDKQNARDAGSSYTARDRVMSVLSSYNQTSLQRERAREEAHEDRVEARRDNKWTDEASAASSNSRNGAFQGGLLQQGETRAQAAQASNNGNENSSRPVNSVTAINNASNQNHATHQETKQATNQEFNEQAKGDNSRISQMQEQAEMRAQRHSQLQNNVQGENEKIQNKAPENAEVGRSGFERAGQPSGASAVRASNPETRQTDNHNRPSAGSGSGSGAGASERGNGERSNGAGQRNGFENVNEDRKDRDRYRRDQQRRRDNQ